jgi:hypothetical protein
MSAPQDAAAAVTRSLNVGLPWVLLFASSAFLPIYAAIILGLVLLGGRDFSGNKWAELVAFSPSAAAYFVISAVSILGLGLFGMAVSRFGFRSGQRWAWYVLWYLPAFGVLGEIADFSIQGTHAVSFLLVGVLSVVGLLLPFRRFFPKDKPADGS